MASSMDRVMAKVAAGLLPGLLPTPPRSTKISPCLIILPSSFASKPKHGRADSVERWDAHKEDRKPCSPSSLSSCGSSSPGRASSADRWDMNTTISRSSSSSSRESSTSSSGAPSCERWESNKRSNCERWDISKRCWSSSSTSSSSSSSRESSATVPGRASSCQKWDINKRGPSRVSESSADRWDIHKKPRSPPSDAESRTGEQEEMEIDDELQPQEDGKMEMVPAASAVEPLFSGSSFFASPDPSMLPMPTFFRARCPGMMHVPAH